MFKQNTASTDARRGKARAWTYLTAAVIALVCSLAFAGQSEATQTGNCNRSPDNACCYDCDSGVRGLCSAPNACQMNDFVWPS